MARIQDVKQFEDLMYERVNEYLQEMDCYDNPQLAIYREDGEHFVLIDDSQNLNLPQDNELYSIDLFIRKNEDGSFEPEGDQISKVANDWIFIEH